MDYLKIINEVKKNIFDHQRKVVTDENELTYIEGVLDGLQYATWVLRGKTNAEKLTQFIINSLRHYEEGV